MPFSPTPLLRRLEPLRKFRRMRWPGYLTAVATVAAAAAFRMALGRHLASAAFLSFFPAVALSSLLGGLPSGALAVALSSVTADLLFLRPAGGAARFYGLAPVLFLVFSAFLAWMVDLLCRLAELACDQAEEIRIIVEAHPAGVVVVDAQGIIRLVNRALERQLGYRRDELVGRAVEILVPEGLRAQHRAHRRAFMEHPEPRLIGPERDVHARCKDGSLLPVEIGLSPLHRQRLIGAMATVIDIRQRKDLEWRAKMLTDEVRHRARNLLTVVQALARRSLSGEERKAFIGLLEALARTQELFGADAPASLASLAEAELASFRDQVTISGCDVLLAPTAAQDFSLILHELATNALKYGALSTADGRVAISGQEHPDESFTFLWSERGGPRIAAPDKTGLGRTILQDVARGFAAKVEAHYRPGGFRYRLELDLHRIRQEAAPQPQTGPQSAEGSAA